MSKRLVFYATIKSNTSSENPNLGEVSSKNNTSKYDKSPNCLTKQITFICRDANYT